MLKVGPKGTGSTRPMWTAPSWPSGRGRAADAEGAELVQNANHSWWMNVLAEELRARREAVRLRQDVRVAGDVLQAMTMRLLVEGAGVGGAEGRGGAVGARGFGPS